MTDIATTPFPAYTLCYTTPQLRRGDVIRVHGARVELTGEPRTFVQGTRHVIYSWVDMPIITGAVVTMEHLKVWTVQGGSGTTWPVERGEIGRAEDAVEDARRMFSSHVAYHGHDCTWGACEVAEKLGATLNELAAELTHMIMPGHDESTARAAQLMSRPDFDMAVWRAATRHAETLWPVKTLRADGEIARDPRWWDAAFKAYGV